MKHHLNRDPDQEISEIIISIDQAVWYNPTTNIYELTDAIQEIVEAQGYGGLTDLDKGEIHIVNVPIAAQEDLKNKIFAALSQIKA